MNSSDLEDSNGYEVRKLVFVFAHPDDEILVAGTIAKYVQHGAEVMLVTTTNGGGGAALEGASSRQLSDIRQRELRDACGVLGIARLELLEQRHHLSMHLNQQNYRLVSGQHQAWVRELIEEWRPQVVVTFGPDGITGHPTHIMVSELTTHAVSAVSRAPILYYVAWSATQVAQAYDWCRSHPNVLRKYEEDIKGKPNLRQLCYLDETSQLLLPLLHAVSDQDISTEILVEDYVQLKRLVIDCHKSQGGAGGALDVYGLSTTEYFVRALTALPHRNSSQREFRFGNLPVKRGIPFAVP